VATRNYNTLSETELQPSEDNNEIGNIQSIMAGFASGLYKIPEGFLSLGAMLMDMGADTNKAAEVEKYFAEINPFDEMAEATTAGKLTEIIVNTIGAGGPGLKIASSLAKGAIVARQSGKYMNVVGKSGDKVKDAIQAKLQKIKGPSLTRRGKVATYGAGAIGGGVGEAIFVDDVEDIGTFGDLIGGPTELDRGLEGTDYDPGRALLNRLKFGVEGAAFTGLLGAAGAGIKKLKDSTNAGRAVDGAFNKFIDRWVSQPFRVRGKSTKEEFLEGMKLKGALASDTNVTEGVVRELDDRIGKLFPWFRRVIGDKTVDSKRKALLKEMNEVLLSSEKYSNKLDPKYEFGVTRRLNPAGKKMFERAKKQYNPNKTGGPGEVLENGSIAPLTEETYIKRLKPALKRKLTGIEQTGIEKVKFGRMNKKAMENFTTKLRGLGASSNDIADIQLNLGVMRSGWGDLFTSMGKRLDEKAIKTFQDTFGNKVTTWLDSTYDVIKNRKSKLGEMYTPTKQIMNSAMKSFKELYKKNIGKELSDAAAKQEVLKVYNTAKLPPGFKLNNNTDVTFKIPNFFLGKSSASEALQATRYSLGSFSKEVNSIGGGNKQVLEDLFGKSNDALQTILNGTGRLSAIVRRNEYFDNIANVSNKMKETYKAWIDGGRVGPAPPRPTFADDAVEAQEMFGGIEGVDWKAVTPVDIDAGAKKVFGLEKLDSGLDYAQTLKPLKGASRETAKKVDKQLADAAYNAEALTLENIKDISVSGRPKKGIVEIDVPIHNPLQTKYALTGTVDSIVKPIDEIAASKGMVSQIYQNLILYPKATSQMAKTILSPFTHARNFISAGAFAMANGIIPFSDAAAIKKAYTSLQVLGPGTRNTNEFYQKLLKLGVVNSQVQLGDLTALLRDVNFGGIGGKLASGDNLASFGLNRLLKGMSKLKKFSEDAYTAEDDFWKIFSFLGEQKRLSTSYKSAGLNLGDEFHTMKDAPRFNELIEAGMRKEEALELVPRKRLTEELLEEEAADIIKNNIPNYAYVSEAVQALRKAPLGNFVSFPAEIMRTGTNIIQRSLDEIFYTTTINGKKVNPFRKTGMKRLAGMAFTTVAVPSGAVAAASALYDVTSDEREAMRRYVAKWSKNSTLIPIRNKETGKLSYIDFSHTNAYDTLTRPFQTILNRVQAGEVDKNGMMDDFIMGLIESTKELGSPFISESIWTEALVDVSPMLGRGGRTREGFRVWREKDPIGTKMSKAVIHLANSQLPLNWKQAERIGLAMKPKDDVNRLDKRGKQYELGKELAGIAGARVIDIDPERGIIYKTAQYTRDARESKSLFSTVALKGGVVAPKDLIDAYITANNALFDTQKELARDLEAAEILKGDQRKIGRYVSSKIGNGNYSGLKRNIFIPYIPSRNVFEKSQQITRSIQEVDPTYTDPLREVLPIIASIRREIFRTDLNNQFPIIENPLNTSLGEGFMETVRGSLPAFVPGFTGENYTNTNQVAGVVPASNIKQEGKEVFNKPGEIVF